MIDPKPVKILHFADSHIDIANYGRHDPETGLAVRVMDFLNALDQIVDAAIDERVDMVIFAGDAYKDRHPQPTFQREWGRRMMRLSQAGIPVMLLVGNHDMAPADHRANTVQEYATLSVPNIFVGENLKLWGPDELGVPVQVLTLPWITRSRFLARQQIAGKTVDEIHDLLLERLTEAIEDVLTNEVDPALPLILTAHASVLGAKYGSERLVMLGQDLALSMRLVTDRRFDYVALGHIHKHQSLNEKPPVVYSGSIERIDFGESKERKGYVLAEVSRGHTAWRFVPLQTRPYFDEMIRIAEAEGFMEQVFKYLPPPEEAAGAVCRFRIEYPYELDPLLDEKLIRERYADALELRVVKKPIGGHQSRIGDIIAVESLSPYEQLRLYWGTKGRSGADMEELLELAESVLHIHVPTMADSGQSDS